MFKNTDCWIKSLSPIWLDSRFAGGATPRLPNPSTCWRSTTKLLARLPVPALNLVNIYGERLSIGGCGRRTLLSFLRDAACPSCNFRIYELTTCHNSLASLGLDILAVFNSTPAEVMRFVARQRRPFRIAADPTSNADSAYGIERSFLRKLKAVVLDMPTLIKGLRIVGPAGLNTG